MADAAALFAELPHQLRQVSRSRDPSCITVDHLQGLPPACCHHQAHNAHMLPVQEIAYEQNQALLFDLELFSGA